MITCSFWMLSGLFFAVLWLLLDDPLQSDERPDRCCFCGRNVSPHAVECGSCGAHHSVVRGRE